MAFTKERIEYLKLLAEQFPNIRSASTEIINLSAILELPKGTEHFLSDVHGEYEPFVHVLRNGSGSIKRRIDEVFGFELDKGEKKELATLIYYPEQKMPQILCKMADQDGWYRKTLFQLIRLCRVISSKYTRNKVRKALPEDFRYILQELLHEQESIANRQEYYNSIITSIIDTGRAEAFITALARIIPRLSIDHLHVIGDVYDRGPGAHIIMDMLMNHHSLDFQWGNHDIVWMGAAAGSLACICNVIRVSLRYSNMETLENGYAISMLPLVSLAVNVYGDDNCELFYPKQSSSELSENEKLLMARMHKAITIIQLKLESQIIKRRAEYDMNDRLLLDKIDYEKGTVKVNGKSYKLLDTNFPTIDPKKPFELSKQEKSVMDKLLISFKKSERLQQHVRFLYSKGSMYLAYNGNLLYHGCIPMDEKGNMRHFKFDGVDHGPKEYMDRLERVVRQGYFAKNDPDKKLAGMDAMWYLWSGSRSPLFGKDKMATFERYFIAEKETHKETKDPYYDFRTKEDIARKILQEFGLDPDKGHIINGHVPVKAKIGESPIKAGGKLIVIDGGFARAYQKETGIAGYTLIYNSYGLLLASHQPFESTQKAIDEGLDIHSNTNILENNTKRIRVRNTDNGRVLQKRIDDLNMLLEAYRSGLIKEL